MSPSQDVSQVPVPIRIPAPSPPEVPDEPMGLCAWCWEAHHAALRDDNPPWVHCYDYVQFGPEGVTKTFPLPADLWPDLPRLFGSAQAGCAFCAFLREAILSDKFNDAWENSTSGINTKSDRKLVEFDFYYGRHVPDPLSPLVRRFAMGHMIVRVTFEERLTILLYFELEAITGEHSGLIFRLTHKFNNFCLQPKEHPAVAEWLVLRPPAVRNYESDEIISFLNKQMRKRPLISTDKHDNPQFLPERLVEVGLGNLRLVERESICLNSAEPPQYCALSHCWGPPKDAKSQPKVMRNNLQQYNASLDFDALSPVLKDAVKVTRSLSIPYLWVDSLCILQDDVSEWQTQCSQMNDIYGKARVTLIVTSSGTCKEGFLSPKRHELRFPYQSVRRPDIWGSFMMNFTYAYGEAGISSFETTLINNVDKELRFSQWARRGWTFQEEAMAGERIVFGGLGVYFGRLNLYVSKDGFAGAIASKAVSSRQSTYELHRAWRRVICRYSAFTPSSFTNPTDFLPALSGLARLFGNILKVDYLAGHWVDKLHCSLIWMVASETAAPSLDNIITTFQSQEPYLVPTWSGLTRGKIEYPRNIMPGYAFSIFDCRSEITILDVHMPTVGNDRYGAIKDACLTLEGYVLNLASLSWVEMPEKLVGSRGSQTGIYFQEDTFNPSEPNMRFFRVFDGRRTSEQPESYAYHLRLDFQVDSGNRALLGKLTGSELLKQFISRVTFLLVGFQEPFQERPSEDAIHERDGYGLVLVPLEGASKGSFLRVGIFYPEQARQDSVQKRDLDNLPALQHLMTKETVKLF